MTHPCSVSHVSMKKKFKKIIVIEKIEGGGEGRGQVGLVAVMIMPQQ